jgi:hypothetical protein
MKLTRLEVVNVLGIARAEIDLTNAVTVITGMNESGKSSISDALSMAFIGKPRRVDTKKELGQLLHDGAQKGRIAAHFGGGDDGAEFRLPKGDHLVSEFAGAAFVPYVLDPGLFARISADDRRSFLFNLTGCKASGSVIREKLEARGASEEMIKEISPMLRDGFPKASAEAYNRAKAAKGAWRQVTGGTWGAVVAEDWRAERPEGLCPTEKELNEIMSKQTAAQENVTKDTAYVGGLDSKRKASESFVTRKATAKALADQLEARQQTLDKAQAELSELEALYAPMQQKLTEMQAGVVPVACPCCAAELTIKGQTLTKFAGLKADTKATSDLALELTQTRQTISAMKGMMPNYIGSVAEAQAAVTQLAAIEAEKVEVIDQAKIDSATAKLAQCRELADALRKEFNTKQQARIDFSKVEETTKEAAAAHAEVKAWLAVGDALAPDGIPAEILAGALAPVNQSLAVLSGMCGWKPAVINEDMTLSYGGRMYELNSESGQWRFDCLVALAIAQISDLRMVVLDRFDVLDLKSRGALMKMLMELGRIGAMHTSIMCGTMKELPSLPDGVGGVWISNGLAELAVKS